MADAIALECPPTSNNQMEFSNASNTQGSRILEFLKNECHPLDANRSDIDVESSGDEQQRSSPPPNCPICLGRVKDKCFTNSCMHQFCFKCLVQWTKVKPECPLCKQSFKSIIHKITSIDSYEEYHVEVTHQQHVNWINLPNTFQPLNFYLPPRVAINGIPLQDASRNRIFQLFLNESPQTERFSRLYANDAIPPRYAGGPWRTYCYYRRLYAMPIPNALGSYARTITAQFYRENQAQLHRLMPWLNRELLCLCAASAESIEGLLSRVNNLIQTHDMTSREFRRRVAPLVPNHTNHFIHELINFARSPFDMIGYDRNVAYCPVFVDDMVVVVSSSDEDELLIVPVTDQTASTSGAAPAQESSGVNAPGMPTIIMSDSGESSGDDQSAEYALPNVATDVALNVDVACNITHNYEDSDEEISNFLQNKSVGVQEIVRGRASAAPETSTSSLYSSTILTNNDRSVIVRISSHASTAASSEPARVPTPAAGNDSDSDDCQFVCAKKPPHLRTPEFVELNSESDSDVVFVDMDVVPQPQPIKQENKELLNVRRLRHRTVVPPDSENGRNVLKVEQNSLFSVINVLNLPSTSSQWMGNAFSAPVQSSSAATFPVIRSRGKRIYETSESSSSSLTPSPAHTDSSSDGNRSSSHEEYVVPSSARKRKASTGSARKKYRKKSKSKTKSKSKSKPKKTERAQKRYKRSPKMRKIQNDDSSSTDSESEN